MQKSMKTLGTHIELLAESLATFLYTAQRCLFVCLYVCLILTRNGQDYFDIVSLFLLSGIVEFNILITINVICAFQLVLELLLGEQKATLEAPA